MKVSLIRAKYHSVWEPTNLMYIAGYAKAKIPDLDIQILDGYFMNDSDIAKVCHDSDFIGLSGTTPQVPHMLRLAEMLKKPHNKIVAGGYGPSLQPFKFLNDPNIDHLVVGEGEHSFLQILDSSICPSQKLVSSPPIADIDTIPNPDREHTNLEQYILTAKREEGRRVTSILTERGCAFGCTFGAEGEFGTIWRKASVSKDKGMDYERPIRFRERHAKLVVAEMLEVRDKYDIEFFKMNDAETNPTRAHFIKLCREMYEQGLRTPWGCNMRCDKVDDEMCYWAVKAQCTEFWMGLESGSPEIHRHINKGTTVPMITKAFQLAQKYKIHTRTYTLLGTPPESYDTIKETEALIDLIDPDIIGFSILAPYPGTAYYKPEYEKIDWSQIDEYSNHLWASDNLTNDELRSEQARLMEKYEDKLAKIVQKKRGLGIIDGARVLESL